jgi:hypothetical protein
MKFLLLILLVLSILLGCKKGEDTQNNTIESSEVKTSTDTAASETNLNDSTESDYKIPGEFAVISGNNVRIRYEPNLNAAILDNFYKGNVIYIQEEVEGDIYKESSLWYKIKSSHLVDEGYVHSSFVLKGTNAENFNKSITFESQMEFIKQIFSDDEINSIVSLYRTMNEVKTESDFAKFYKEVQTVKNRLDATVDAIYQNDMNAKPKTAWLYTFFPFLYLSYGPEGMSVFYIEHYPSYYSLANKTDSTADNAFISLMIESYGEFYHWTGNWFLQTWDYGGRSLLGTGVHLSILEKSESLSRRTKNFDSELNALREQIIRDIEFSLAYDQPKEKAVAELKEILSTINLTPQEKTTLETRLAEFENPPEDKTIQFNCQSNNCDEGG